MHFTSFTSVLLQNLAWIYKSKLEPEPLHPELYKIEATFYYE
jgi:hypothetical protein